MAYAQHTNVTTYPERFQTYIAWSVEHVLQAVPQNEEPLPATVRDQALHVLSFALVSEEAWPATRALLLAIAPKMEQAGYWDEWIPYLEKGRMQSQELEDLKVQALLDLELGLLRQLQNKFGVARTHLTACIANFQALGEIQNQAKALNRLAYNERLEQNYDEAKETVQSALDLLDPNDIGRGFSYFVKGTIAYDERNWAQSTRYFEQSLALWQESNDKRRTAWGLRNLGPALSGQGLHQEAIDCYEQALQLLSELHDPVQKAITHMNLGVVYSKRNCSSDALQQYALAKPVFDAVQSERSLAMYYMNTGIEYRKLQEWTNAEQACKASIQWWQRMGNIRSLANALDELGLVYMGQGRYPEAVTIFENALKKLSEIEDNPRYQYHFKNVSKHLSEAKSGVK